jgi:outer membrane protein TolC
VVAIAQQYRLDLQAAQESTEEALARVDEEILKIFPNVEVGLAFERSERRGQRGRKLLADAARTSLSNGALSVPEIQTRGQRQLEDSSRIAAILGPSLSVTLPVFDQNQAQIAKAEFEYQQALALLEGLERSITQEARQAVDRAVTAATVARLFRDEVQPQAQRTLSFARESYTAGKASILVVIDAQRTLLETRRLHVSALQEAAAAVADLERVAARPVTALRGVAATQPVSVGLMGENQ